MPPTMSCISPVDFPPAPQAVSVPSETNACPEVPTAKADGLPDESPMIIFPLATPASLANVIASSAKCAVSILPSTNASESIALAGILPTATVPSVLNSCANLLALEYAIYLFILL